MKITFEVTDQPHLLKRYYEIREACFRKDLSLNGFDGSEDIHDKEGYIVIAKHGNRVVGGARINGTNPDCSTRLPMESDDFLAKDIFPELSLENESYCQWTRLALLPEYRTKEVVRELCLSLPKISAELNFKYAFNITGTVRARLYRRILASDGIDYKICKDVSIPAEPGFTELEHLLSIAVLKENVSHTERFDSFIADRNSRQAYRYEQPRLVA